MEKIFVITFVLHLSAIGSGIIIHKDGCIHNKRRSLINCRDEHWNHIPFDYFQNKNFHTLDLGVNDITSLNDAQKFLELPSKDRIETIYLDNNQISELPHRLFGALTNLQVLDLSNNSITHIPRSFCHMTSLTDLILDGNPIQTISKNAFGCLRKLKFLSLAKCNIHHLPVDFLKGSNLEELNLLENAIENLEEVNFPLNLQVIATPQGAKTEKLFSNVIDGGPPKSNVADNAKKMT